MPVINSLFLVSLVDRAVVITDSQSAIGKSIALLLAKSGADIVITDIRPEQERLHRLLSRLETTLFDVCQLHPGLRLGRISISCVAKRSISQQC